MVRNDNDKKNYILDIQVIVKLLFVDISIFLSIRQQETDNLGNWLVDFP